MERIVCHCFGYSKADIERDVKRHGRSTIAELIEAEARAGNCRCAERNPGGT
ncbi:MAG: (2Fe-2S)-binding protein [Fretibacterium sp.]|uniref:(2Fe-2S)-binding protein n=1 Tax=Fretibacterium sp. OH1220_COT-178 TaxID=2491047 RepID=UPI000F5E1577|nr:(2Fe-2S)-binding protein [Fretibacterium sp. OH1220_COT-178]MDO4786221.1 (2Fe-2S)-binding protein [Fretibacterium sp.]RRD64539.1 BFD-like (2Fe-2S) protein [Fretibacterium sp. OH1220_COT-178]